MMVDTKFDVGQMVCLKHDPDKVPRMIVSVTVSQAGSVRYMMICGTNESWHFEMEIDEKKNTEKKKVGFAQ